MDCHFTEAPLSSSHFVQWIVNSQFFSSSGFQIEIVIDTFEFVNLPAFANLGALANSGELYL